jgi:3-keto-5-aminohexanoate cleavage enzyme
MTEPDPLIINVALTGNVPAKSDNPAVPVTPEEIAADARRCYEAGAAIVHLHVRDEQGRATCRKDVFAEAIAQVREACPEVIVCATTSGRVNPDYEARSQVLELDGDLKPELASLALGSFNFPQQASVSEPETIRRLAERMLERGIVPELEVFDLGMLDYARYLIRKDLLKPPFYVNLLLGSLGTLAATPFNLSALLLALPEDSVWSGAGMGRFQFPVNSMAVAMGGHVRTGLEDSLFMDAEKTIPASNPALVERIVELARSVGREIASPDQVRQMIGLAPPAAPRPSERAESAAP